MGKIKGYRELTAEEVALVNDIKVQGEVLGELVARVRAYEGVDQRWCSIGATDLQTGCMALVRSVAKPSTF